MNAKLWYVMLALAAVVALTSSTDAQIQDNGCGAARTWHLQQAMKASLAGEQDYHLGAADAANQLATASGTPCAGWKDWAMGRTPATEP